MSHFDSIVGHGHIATSSLRFIAYVEVGLLIKMCALLAKTQTAPVPVLVAPDWDTASIPVSDETITNLIACGCPCLLINCTRDGYEIEINTFLNYLKPWWQQQHPQHPSCIGSGRCCRCLGFFPRVRVWVLSGCVLAEEMRRRRNNDGNGVHVDTVGLN